TTGYFGNIHINLKGREPQGLVEQGQHYKEVIESLKEKLSLLKDPETGERVIEKVYHRDELYHGSHVDRGPDLIVVYKDFAYYSFPRLKLSEPIPVFESCREANAGHKLKHMCHHRMNGICIFWGSNIRGGKRLDDPKIIDLAPTILHILNVEIPKSIDGKVLKEIYKEGFLANQPIRYSGDTGPDGPEQPESLFSDKEKEEFEKKLKGLGYLD
ncbi:hypothetical protein ACFLU6_07450, partial [Acidobacteriota bacterium]